LDLFVNCEEQRRQKVAHYGSENPQDGAANYYLPDVDSLQLAAWFVKDILPTVQQQLRLLDPIAIAPPTFQICSLAADQFQTDRSDLQPFNHSIWVIFPDWSQLNESGFFELVEMVKSIGSRAAQSPIYLFVYAGDISHQLIQTIFTNVLTELLITDQVESQNLKVLILDQDSAAAIVEANPTRIMLGNEDHEAIAKFGATLSTAILDDLRI